MTKHFLLTFSLLFLLALPGWGSFVQNTVTPPDIVDDASFAARTDMFRQSIPGIAKAFIGIPYQYGGDPRVTGTTDNSHLFYTIYALAAQKAGMPFSEYLPMNFLLQHLRPVSENEIQNGDLIVLKDNLSAMLYQVDKTGKIYLIYASKKRREVLSFNSDNLVFHVFWLENLKGFYRLKESMLKPSK